ncbi:MAG: hypothetical protein E6J34_11555 [Chloroflexi bacterium]|nr:MAG: hypothetical protein E6J34_11555 [Chloroflexota bacterium]
MGINPNQSEDSDARGYGGYSGTPPRQHFDANDPYGAYGSGQQSGTGSTQQQQQQYYEPPQSATARSSRETHDTTSTSLDAKTEALLSYLFGWLGGLVFLVIERKNRFVRFAAAQSVILTGPTFVVYVLLQLIAHIPFIGLLLAPIVSCLTFVILVPTALIWLFLMVQAYRGIETKLPIVGDYAEALANKFFGQRPA